MLILDQENASLPAATAQTFMVGEPGRLFISALAPAATCLRVSLRKQGS
jgi:hypothetical protein